MPPDLGVAAERRLARQSEAGAPAVLTGTLAAPYAGATPQAYDAPPWCCSHTGGTEEALEHGFCT